jgi:hypothetical protein
LAKKLILLILLFLFLEILLRLIFPIPELANYNRIIFQNTTEGENLPYITYENLTWQSTPDTAHKFVHHLNEYGFRDKSWNVEKEKKRIFILGDSFVEGDMVEDDETIPAVFQSLIGEETEVFNCGMNGTGFSSYLKFLHHSLPIFQPDEVNLLIYANDIAPFEIPNTTLFVPEYNSSFLPRLSYLINRLVQGKKINIPFLRPSNPFLFPVPDGFNPFTSNAFELEPQVIPELRKAMVKGEANYFMINNLKRKETSFSMSFDLSGALKFIKNTCEVNNAKLNVFYIPDRNQISDDYIRFEKDLCLTKCNHIQSLSTPKYQANAIQLAKSCQDLRINFYDLRADLRTAEKQTNLYWNYDEHMRASGYRLIAEKMVELEMK